MKNIWEKLKRPIIALSPMADMTDSPFTEICREMGADIVFREMVSSEAVCRGNEKTIEMCGFNESERPIVQQIFGGDPARMALAAQIVEEKFHPDGIDINMGCPVYKIVSQFNGAALLKDMDNAKKIIREMKKVISVPLSVKVRLGWSKPTEVLEFIRHIEDAGANLITIHGRTKEQAYTGKSDWGMIGRARELVSVPVLANGDIHNPEQIPAALKITGAAGVLIARGALGNPWFFKKTKLVLDGKDPNLAEPTKEERRGVILRHAKAHIAHYGEGGIVTFRKHLSYYFKGVPNAKELRTALVQVKSFEELEQLLSVSY